MRIRAPIPFADVGRIGVNKVGDMEDGSMSNAVHEPAVDSLREALDMHRRRVREFLKAQVERRGKTQSELETRIERILDALQQESDRSSDARKDLARRAEELARQTEHATGLQEALAAQQRQWEQVQERTIEQYRAIAAQVAGEQEELVRRQESLERRRAEIDVAEARSHATSQSLSLSKQSLEAELQRASELRQRLETELTEVAAQRQQVAADATETECQRRRIAEQWKAQRATHLRELDQRRQELNRLSTTESGELRRQIEEQSQQIDAQSQRIAELSGELRAARQQEATATAELESFRARQASLAAEVHKAAAHDAQVSAELETERGQEAELQRQIDSLRARLAEVSAQLGTEMETLRQRDAEQSARLEAMRTHEAALTSELETLRIARRDWQAERESLAAQAASSASASSGDHAAADALKARIAQLEKQLAAAESVSPQGGDEELQRRYELAMDDVRELKSRCTSLEESLREARANATRTPAASTGMDWEAQKRRLLAALESDDENASEEERKQRLEMEEVIRSTDLAVAEKAREVAELRQLLENQAGNLGAVAVGAAALGEMLDKDALIQEERESLKRLQHDWEQKLRQAEVEISIERAKIARDRALLEERIQGMGGKAESGGSGDPAENAEKTSRGRWRARLGLGGSED
jgi:chromosome segregation ATPase